MIDKAHTISVIIPAFNAENTIEETLHSVLQQTYPVHEIIVVDDGSKDNTLKKLYDMSSRYPLIRFVNQNNQGVSAARNLAAKQATGDWLAFVDADDLWLPNKLAKQVEDLADGRWSACDSFYFGYGHDGSTKRSDLSEISSGHVFEALLLDNFLTTSTVLIEKNLFWQAGGFDESLLALEDWQLWLSVSLLEPLKMIDEPLVRYRVYPGSTSRKARHILPLHMQLIDTVFSQIAAQPFLSNRKNAKANSYSICSYIAEDSQDYAYALYCAYCAFKLQPTSVMRIKRLLNTAVKRLIKKSNKDAE
ncbi:glycosyltransferase family 2 protein [Gayadomonas joobiniege]|uniref:glycosyltransferase family 2 protein n=1 Tax=Gayadomonas joobiniege TaxID=1234606 RepID=UPI000379771A|nr:glycosyltransferase family 2 protein [Gayadomonas joobiniege]